jgi:hypothetical protein
LTHQLDAPVLEHHHVARAERAVDEAQPVKRLNGSTEVERQAECVAERDRPSHLAQATPLDDFHHHEGPAASVFAELQHPNQSWMGRGRRDHRPARALEGLRGGGRAGNPDPMGQEPDRDLMTGCLVLGQTHGPEGTGPKPADDPVATLDARPGHGGVDRERGRRRPDRALLGIPRHEEPPITLTSRNFPGNTGDP